MANLTYVIVCELLLADTADRRRVWRVTKGDPKARKWFCKLHNFASCCFPEWLCFRNLGHSMCNYFRNYSIILHVLLKSTKISAKIRLRKNPLFFLGCLTQTSSKELSSGIQQQQLISVRRRSKRHWWNMQRRQQLSTAKPIVNKNITKGNKLAILRTTSIVNNEMITISKIIRIRELVQGERKVCCGKQIPAAHHSLPHCVHRQICLEQCGVRWQMRQHCQDAVRHHPCGRGEQYGLQRNPYCSPWPCNRCTIRVNTRRWNASNIVCLAST